jgi:ribosome-binding factor A
LKRDRGRRAEAEAALAGGAPSRRSERVASEIQRALATALVRDVRDPEAAEANVTRVRVTPDLRLARIYFALLDADGEAPERVAAALRRVAPFLRRRLARDLGLRFTPELDFFFDEELADARRVDSLLRTMDGAGAPDDEGGED